MTTPCIKSTSTRSSTRRLLFASLCANLLTPSLSLASTLSGEGGWIWENILSTFADSFTGPVLFSIGIMAIGCSGVAMAFMDLQGGAKYLVRACLGCGIGFSAPTILASFGLHGAII